MLNEKDHILHDSIHGKLKNIQSKPITSEVRIMLGLRRTLTRHRGTFQGLGKCFISWSR